MNMEKKSANGDLRTARAGKKDEFYTQIADIEKEVGRYKQYLKDKVVFCNCDDPRESNFWRYFEMNFKHFELRKLVSTHYDQDGPSYKLEATRDGDGYVVVQTPLECNGDFRSEECICILKEADIVITNPPFSLFREYIALLMAHDKKFIILGNIMAATYKDVFGMIMENKVWLGHSISSGDREFRVPPDYPLEAAGFRTDSDGNNYIRVKGVRWYTNLEHSKRNEDIVLFQHYTSSAYPTYSNYEAIEVTRIADVPVDYPGVMGVPVTFLDKYNPEQFEIIGSSSTLGKRMSQVAAKGTYPQGGPSFYLSNGDGTHRRLFGRIAIRRKAVVTQSEETVA